MAEVIQVQGRNIAIRGRLIKTAFLIDEWDHDLEDPGSFVKALKQQVRSDLLTFLQRPTETRPKYDFYWEPKAVAVIPITTYKFWFETQIKKTARRAIRKALKSGVDVKILRLDDKFIEGIMSIYNETPLRQGKRFPHYEKSFDAVKRINSSYLDRSQFIGAYYKDELIGFIKLQFMENYADTMQCLAKIQHRDKSPVNALLAKAVEICDHRRLPYLFYGEWSRAHGLDDFKRNTGFEELYLPRYYIPLTTTGKIILGLNLHHNIVGILPERLVRTLRKLRTKWHSVIIQSRSLIHG